ncbi:hypothetical protein HZH66_003928 [Vespula vulgaris]|uniref:Uncharacterized protein n=1 Tax=Vespula vulgaris TaxID=7454 RepID=A0A834KE76_VESVU|nr:hypothetical protein HZH66_003928 [Vespula vulgaris]
MKEEKEKKEKEEEEEEKEEEGEEEKEVEENLAECGFKEKWGHVFSVNGNAGNVANNVPPSPPAASRIQNTEGQVQQDGAAALHRVLCAESIVEKERRLSEMILQLQLLREQLLQQQDQKVIPVIFKRCYVDSHDNPRYLHTFKAITESVG